jgi:hypothetical protein
MLVFVGASLLAKGVCPWPKKKPVDDGLFQKDR